MGICSLGKQKEDAKETFFAPNQHLVTEYDFAIYETEWNLKPTDIKLAMRFALDDSLYVSKNHTIADKMKCFLYSKHVLDPEPMMRHFSLKQIFGNRDGSKPFERLHRIVETGETNFTNCVKFDAFVKMHPKWGSKTSWVAFRDHPLLEGKDAYVERTQLSSLCFMHSSICLQKYLVTMYSPPQAKVGMVNIADFLRRHADSDALKQHIMSNTGGHSIAFLKNLLQLKDHGALEKPDIKSLAIPNLLKEYGPGLISSMEIWSCFYDQTKDVHLTSPSGLMIGHHSMVLVGFRLEGTEIRYLLQNWWENKAFIEVNAFYLRATGAILTFCTAPQTSIPSTFATNYSRHVECSPLLEACEFLPYETRRLFYVC